MKIRSIVLVIVLSAVSGVTLWRAQNPRERVAVSLESLNVRPAPDFQLLDQNSRPSQLKGYLGRYRVLLCFFDAAGGPDGDPVALRLREVYPALKRLGIVALAVSTPLGPEQKSQTLSYPFPVLRDTLAGQPGSCCTVWGRTSAATDGSPMRSVEPALFLIEANGTVPWSGDHPAPVEDPQSLINALVSGQR